MLNANTVPNVKSLPWGVVSGMPKMRKYVIGLLYTYKWIVMPVFDNVLTSIPIHHNMAKHETTNNVFNA